MVDRRKQAQKLVDNWGRTDAERVKVYAFHLHVALDSEPSEFLIVSGSSLPIDSVEPFGFGASTDVPFPTRIAEVATDVFEKNKSHQGFLPSGWHLHEAVELEPHR